jgi:S1-C subfamily serine protease
MKTKAIGGTLFILALATVACSSLLGTENLSRISPPAPTLPATSAPDTAGVLPIASDLTPITAGDLVSLYNGVHHGVVTIWAYEDIGEPHSMTIPRGQGSGFVIDQSGHIVTNEHVIEGAADIEVAFPSGLKAWAEVVGSDPDSDLAVLKVNIPPEALTPLSLGDSDLVKVGEFVVAIGNPFGLEGTMTVGIVSALGRTLSSRNLTPSGIPFTAGDMIQTDAAINPGNSGGPLLDLAGNVIGVNLAIQSESFTVSGSPANSGVGFAVPVNIVRRVVPGIIENGKYDYPYLGISSLDEQSWNLKTIEALGFDADTNGAYITEVVSGGPADRAGLRGGTVNTDIPGIPAGGDLIIAIDGNPIKQFSELLSYLLQNTVVGQDIVLSVLRGDEIVDITLTIGSRP